MTGRLICVAVLGIAVVGAGPMDDARAAPTPQHKAAARKLVSEGKQALADKRYPIALKKFQAAFRQWPRRVLRFNIALVHFLMGKRLKAHRELLLYLGGGSFEDRQKLPPFFKRLLGEVGVLDVTVIPAKVEIRVNGKPSGTGHYKRSLNPGRFLITFHRNGEEIGRKELDVMGGQVTRWVHRITAPVRPEPRPAPVTVPAPRKPPRARLHWGWFAATAGVAVVAGGLMAWLGTETNKLEDRFQAAPTTTLQSKGMRYRTATNALVGVTSAAAVTAVVLAFFTRWKRRSTSERATVTPLVSPGSAGMLVRF